MNLKWTWIVTSCWNSKTQCLKRSSIKISQRLIVKSDWVFETRLWEVTRKSLRLDGTIKTRFFKERSLALIKDQCSIGRNSKTQRLNWWNWINNIRWSW